MLSKGLQFLIALLVPYYINTSCGSKSLSVSYTIIQDLVISQKMLSLVIPHLLIRPFLCLCVIFGYILHLDPCLSRVRADDNSTFSKITFFAAALVLHQVKIQKMRANLEEKLMKRMADVRRKAEEWRAEAQFQHSEQVRKVGQQAQKVMNRRKHSNNNNNNNSHFSGHKSCGCFPCNNHL